jgi:thiamine biosynthesis lipoprotein
MAIDLGGIAVGYAVDKVFSILKSDGIKEGLIDAGGEIVVFGNKTYKIGIKNPKGKGIVNKIILKNQAISTSGNYENFIEKDNRKYTYIINPKTGQAIADTSVSLASVTIIANNCTDADAYATAVFVLGLEDGQKLIRKLGYQGILITNNGKMIVVK